MLIYVVFVFLVCVGLVRSNEDFSRTKRQVHGDFAYYISTELLTQEEAMFECKAKGFNSLVSIRNENEQRFLEELLAARSMNRAWIGLTIDKRDADNVQENWCSPSSAYASFCNATRLKWYWLDGTPMEYTKWNDYHPRYQGVTCALLASSGSRDKTWVDETCSGQHGFICKRRDGDSEGTMISIENATPSTEINETDEHSLVPFILGVIAVGALIIVVCVVGVILCVRAKSRKPYSSVPNPDDTISYNDRATMLQMLQNNNNKPRMDLKTLGRPNKKQPPNALQCDVVRTVQPSAPPFEIRFSDYEDVTFLNNGSSNVPVISEYDVVRHPNHNQKAKAEKGCTDYEDEMITAQDNITYHAQPNNHIATNNHTLSHNRDFPNNHTMTNNYNARNNHTLDDAIPMGDLDDDDSVVLVENDIYAGSTAYGANSVDLARQMGGRNSNENETETGGYSKAKDVEQPGKMVVSNKGYIDGNYTDVNIVKGGSGMVPEYSFPNKSTDKENMISTKL